MAQDKRRAFLVVIDSVGCGGAPDANAFFNGTLADTGANTLGHIIAACAEGRANEGRSGSLNVPNLEALGLGAAVRLASGIETPGVNGAVSGTWGAATEISKGKDTPSGHWEMAGVPVPWDWTYFPDETPSFPPEVTKALIEAAGVDGILGNAHASGTQIIETLGAQHVKTGWPICYTSADSVLQIAAHEDHFGLERLLDMCRAVAPLLHGMKVGRVIARPFTGDAKNGFTRTHNRRDFAIAPPSATLCDWAHEADRHVYAIGKIGDIFSMRGIDEVVKGPDLELMKRLSDLVDTAVDGSFTFANFVEFDTQYGHRRDVSGYARALEWFDAEIGPIMARLRDGDLLVITADHGNDPTWPGTDHTRERVPVLVHGTGGLGAVDRGAGSEIGLIAFADIAASIAAHLGIVSHGPGESFL